MKLEGTCLKKSSLVRIEKKKQKQKNNVDTQVFLTYCFIFIENLNVIMNLFLFSEMSEISPNNY